MGGKRQLLPELKRRLPKRFERYHEPFVGGGALFFDQRPHLASLYDNNPDLIELYGVVRDRVEELIAALYRHKIAHQEGREAYFYQIRDLDRGGGLAALDAIERAARFVYLNRTCFNGVYRVNREGFFNVPYGRYKNPLICDEPNLRACSEALKHATLSHGDFEQVLDGAQPGDFVYFDPPYVPLSATANFTGYTAGGFDESMQLRLRDVCDRLGQKGVFVMLSNSSAKWVIETYRAGGYKVEKVKATRAINAHGHKRGAINEVIVRNYTRNGLLHG